MPTGTDIPLESSMPLTALAGTGIGTQPHGRLAFQLGQEWWSAHSVDSAVALRPSRSVALTEESS